MSSRDAILQRLRANARTETLPLAWQSERHFPDMAQRFEEALTAAKGEVYRVDNLAEAHEKVNWLIRHFEATRVVLNDEPPLQNLAHLSDVHYHTVGDEPEALRASCAAAEIGISSADAVLAETGSIVITSGTGRSRLVTLLPPVHIALAPLAALTPDLFTWTSRLDKALPANLNIISGPSKSADIEQILAVGVHGPGRFIVILYS